MLGLLKNLRLGVKVALLGVVSVLTTAAALVALAVWQSGQYNTLAEAEAANLMSADLDHIAQGIYNLIQTENEAVQHQVNSNLNVARHVLRNTGAVSFAKETVAWDAENQFTGEVTHFQIPKLLVGDLWLGQNTDFGTETPVVDAVADLIGETATVFQRMNPEGDMLRVATTIKSSVGKRAIGTYIPARGVDGAPNPVVNAVLKGETYHGRAFVVNAWYLTAYEPIKDEAGDIIGMLYVGAEQKTVEARVRQAVLQTKVGETGYVYVLVGSGKDRGSYVISRNGERDGENIWNEVDSDGNHSIQAIIKKATALKPGQMATERYRWLNPGESVPRWKIARLAYYAPWDWVIGTSTYEDELNRDQAALKLGRDRMISVMCIAGLAIALVIAAAGMLVAWSIVRPIQQMTNAVEAVAQGKLARVVTVQSRDEVGVLANAFNAMTGALERTVSGLRASEEKHRVIFENAIEGIFLSSLAGKLVSANPALARIFGYGSADELVNDLPDLPLRLCVQSGDGANTDIHSLHWEDSVGLEVQFDCKDGRKIWVSLGIGVICGDLGQQSMIQGFVTDITRRKHSEEALLKREADLVRAQAVAHLGNWSWDLVHRTASWSEELYRIFGVDPASFVPQKESIARVIHPDDFGLYSRTLRDASQGQPTESFECRVIRPDGVRSGT